MSTPSMTTSPVPGANIIPDQIVVLDDKYAAFDALLANNLHSSALNVQTVQLMHCHYKEVWIINQKNADPISTPRDM